jgi:Reverse transcriptase (RNA-dependent DNA polymerase)
VSQEEVQRVLNHLPSGKAPGSDGIPNEVLRILGPSISEGLAQAISSAFAGGTLSTRYKESVIIALRKEGKKDYSLPGSYRLIALENTLAKVVEKVIANRLSQITEEHDLLPWTQMGARKNRSTLSAIGLITACVQTAWRARLGCVVFMLSLDLAGAFDKVPHSRLLEILQLKGLPSWLTDIIASFMQDRRTRIAYTGYESDWIEARTGISQGSPLSLILFLFFIAGLLEKFQDPNKDIVGFGFMDDTNLIAWGPSAEDNCRRLTTAHTQCEEWSIANGAKFAPDKYQLIHFTRRRQHAEDLRSIVQIRDHQVALQDKAIRVLGV